MSTHRLLIEKGSDSDKLRIGIVGKPIDSRPFLTIHISHMGEVREEIFWATSLSSDKIGQLLPAEIEEIKDGEIYCAYICSEEKNHFKISFPNLNTLILKKYFRTNKGKILFLSEAESEIVINMQREKNISPLYAEDGHSPNAVAFEIVIFFAGIDLFHPSAMQGISLYPITPGLSNSSTYDAVFVHLLLRHNVKIPQGIEVPKEKLFYQPVFAIDFHQIFALTEASAFKFATTMAQDFSTIIASEKGDKPFPILSFILEHETGNWRINPTNFDFRGNLIPPLFPTINSEEIEKIHPILQTRPYARLVLELYVQSLAERDRSFRFLRQWSLLEMIADKEIPASGIPLLNLDGSTIPLESGTPLTTGRKEGKVYAYLRSGSLPPTYQRMFSGQTKVLEGALAGIDQGGGVITLWQAIAASYKIRNDVAHAGRFDPSSKSKNDRDILCKDFYAGQFNFLENALENSVWREIFQGCE